ncbi:HORMA domain-containing protein 2 isoform X1 [Piliocolobus tephrosceles]|uniref:HORMA domain-containing protein 2 isoform X1 n=1 Tax=Piliocolobus tephrosceles TaxID=591936 RepID=UPI000E6B23C2|nr:HORMA domain-containing protein 2 isoform X1 [Piliocolobus tephrosceles]
MATGTWILTSWSYSSEEEESTCTSEQGTCPWRDSSDINTWQYDEVKETVFPSQITNEHESLKMVKKLFATSISCITYLRGLFPESSYGERHLDDLSLKILREDKKCPGSLHIIRWIQGCFDALEKRYLRMAVLTLYTNPMGSEKVTEMYQFKFKYTKEGATMDFDSHSSSTSFESGTNNEDIKKASVLLIRKLYILMQDLEPLPNNVVLTMKLHYYNAVTPHDYQPLGFKEDVNSHFLLFDKELINVQVGFVSTGFHSMKVKVMTEATKVTDLENNLFRENSTTELAHQGLDCDEEEECNDHVRQSFSDFLLHQLNITDIFQFLPWVEYSVPAIKTETKPVSDIKEFLI